jgi:hypothetical protein
MEVASLKKSTRIPLLQSLHGKALASFVDGALISNARILSEGSIVDGDEGERVYAGSTLLTTPLRDTPALDCGDATDEELCDLLRRSVGLHVRLMRLARAEAERRSTPFLPREMRCVLAFRVDAGVLFVDIDLECPLAAPIVCGGENERGAP